MEIHPDVMQTLRKIDQMADGQPPDTMTIPGEVVLNIRPAGKHYLIYLGRVEVGFVSDSGKTLDIATRGSREPLDSKTVTAPTLHTRLQIALQWLLGRLNDQSREESCD